MNGHRETRSLIVSLPISQASAVSDHHSFDRRVAEAKTPKTDINFVIMDYLISEGYPAAAKKFAAEANLLQHASTESIEERVSIRNAILRGDIRSAIEQINDLDPDILDLDTSLHFALLRLQLIELIRPCAFDSEADITPAIEFAQTSLAPRAPTNPKFLEDLERTMALLIFPPDAPPPMLAGLLDPELRQDVAQSVNEAILEKSNRGKHPKLKGLIKLRVWAEKKAREQGTDLGSNLDIWTDVTGQGNNEDLLMSNDDEADSMST